MSSMTPGENTDTAAATETAEDSALPMDPAAVRARLAGLRGPRFWRSLEELADTEGFRKWLSTEHPRLASAAPLDRRNFLRLMGASLALAGLTACSHPPQNYIVPYVNKPDDQIDGLPRYFATSLTRDGYARGVLVRNNQGRPTKVEGNPKHPASLGSTDIFAQAAILQLWDPDRSQSVRHDETVATWDDFAAALLERAAHFSGNDGEGLRLLIQPTTSPTLIGQLKAFEDKYPRARWHVDNPGPAEGDARYHFDRAKVIVSLDADFLSDPAAAVSNAREFAIGRNPERRDKGMSRLYVIEPTPSTTGSIADHRLPLAAKEIETFAKQLAARVRGQPAPSGSRHARWIDAIAQDLTAARGASIVIAGPTQPAAVHVAAREMNGLLGNLINTMEYVPARQASPPDGRDSLARLAADAHAGKVDTLLILGANPAYDAPADLEMTSALRHVPHLMHLGLYRDETAQTAEWHLPQAHELETWGDARAFDGTPSIAQPLIAPLYGGRSVIETMAMLLGQTPDGHALIKHQWHKALSNDKAWNEALQAGVITGAAASAAASSASAAHAASALTSASSAAPASSAPASPASTAPSASPTSDEGTASARPPSRGDGAASAPPPSRGRLGGGWGGSDAASMRGGHGNRENHPHPTLPLKGRATDDGNGGDLELLFRPDPTIGYGEWSNNGWLQELPKPLTQVTWDNLVVVSPALAKEMGLQNFDGVELQSHGRRVRGPVWIMPGQARHSVTVHFGYGRKRAGRVADGQGFNAYALRTHEAPWTATDLSLKATGETYLIAATQHHFAMENGDPLKVATLETFEKNPKFATSSDTYGEKPPSLYPDYPPADYAWGMSIDLNVCIGCKACTIACQSENNIPVVGKAQTRRGREMHWIRVDRYYDGKADNPKSYDQPVPCMQCEHAPCEVVCPVEATQHNAEGLNLQVYNRCVGTRFCSNNCPYKVRRFNFMQYADKKTPQYKAMRNPEVSVRRRGVMEKCTYCIQRIEVAHIQADKGGRRIHDGEIVTACQAACPTQAIRFGDISDDKSQVSLAKASPRNYAMLHELGTRPRTTYLARVRNPNPALEDIDS